MRARLHELPDPSRPTSSAANRFRTLSLPLGVEPALAAGMLTTALASPLTSSAGARLLYPVH
jgi:hypothetical protein